MLTKNEKSHVRNNVRNAFVAAWNDLEYAIAADVYNEEELEALAAFLDMKRAREFYKEGTLADVKRIAERFLRNEGLVFILGRER